MAPKVPFISLNRIENTKLTKTDFEYRVKNKWNSQLKEHSMHELITEYSSLVLGPSFTGFS